MGTNNHTPYVNDVTNLDADVMNAPLSDLDDAIEALKVVDVGKSDSDHTHDDRYYTETELATASSGAAVDWTNVANKPTVGTGDGDVVAPATNTADYVPQWNGADSKTLKDGFPITTVGKSVLSAADVAAILTLLGLDTQPYIIPVGYVGSPGDAAYLLVPIKFTVAVSFPANFSGSVAILTDSTATAETILTVLKNGNSCGTITFAAAGAVGVFASSGGLAVDFAIGDTIAVKNQTTADTTAANLGITLAGVR